MPASKPTGTPACRARRSHLLVSVLSVVRGLVCPGESSTRFLAPMSLTDPCGRVLKVTMHVRTVTCRMWRQMSLQSMSRGYPCRRACRAFDHDGPTFLYGKSERAVPCFLRTLTGIGLAGPGVGPRSFKLSGYRVPSGSPSARPMPLRAGQAAVLRR